MGMIGYGGDINIWNVDRQLFKITKVRDDWICTKCSASISKGCYCWGKGHRKYCIECGFKIGKKFTFELKTFLQDLVKDLTGELENKEKYLQNNMVANL